MSEDRLSLMRELVDSLNEAADSYYNGRGEIMSDFDKQLKLLFGDKKD